MRTIKDVEHDFKILKEKYEEDCKRLATEAVEYFDLKVGDRIFEMEREVEVVAILPCATNPPRPEIMISRLEKNGDLGKDSFSIYYSRMTPILKKATK